MPAGKAWNFDRWNCAYSCTGREDAGGVVFLYTRLRSTRIAHALCEAASSAEGVPSSLSLVSEGPLRREGDRPRIGDPYPEGGTERNPSIGRRSLGSHPLGKAGNRRMASAMPGHGPRD